MPFDPRKHIIRPPAAGAPQPPRPYKPAKQVLPSTSSRRLAAVPGKIDIVKFEGFPDIVKLDFSQYEGIMPLLKRHICARSELEDAVNNIILNLLVNSPQKVVREGRLDYNHFEKEHNHGQLMEYLRTIPCLELMRYNFPHNFPSAIGNFANKERDPSTATDKKYHIVYLDDPKRTGLDDWQKVLQDCALPRTAPKSVLLLNPGDNLDCAEGMKYIGKFGKVGMYQKV